MPECVLVTGATGGIGQAVCRRLAMEGLQPLIGHRTPRQYEASDLAHESGGIPVVLDMADARSIVSAVVQISGLPSALAGVVLAASPPPRLARFGQVTEEDIAGFWNANVLGPHRLLSRLVKACFRDRKRGRVVALLSEAMGEAGQKAMPNMGAYTISKYGLAGVMALLAADYPWLTVRTVAPGFTETPMLKAFDPRFLDPLRGKAPFAAPEEIAEEIVQLMTSDEKILDKRI